MLNRKFADLRHAPELDPRLLGYDPTALPQAVVAIGPGARPKMKGGAVLAQPGFTWALFFFPGRWYAITSVYDGHGELVAHHVDLGSAAGGTRRHAVLPRPEARPHDPPRRTGGAGWTRTTTRGRSRAVRFPRTGRKRSRRPSPPSIATGTRGRSRPRRSPDTVLGPARPGGARSGGLPPRPRVPRRNVTLPSCPCKAPLVLLPLAAPAEPGSPPGLAAPRTSRRR